MQNQATSTIEAMRTTPPPAAPPATAPTLMVFLGLSIALVAVGVAVEGKVGVAVDGKDRVGVRSVTMKDLSKILDRSDVSHPLAGEVTVALPEGLLWC
jgi:hypothetical protein